MPELPDVESIKNDLLPWILGKRIERVEILDPQVVHRPWLEQFSEQIKGQEIKGVERRGKYLILSLKGGQSLIFHLKMTGSLLLNRRDKYTRAVFTLNNGDTLAFSDIRRLGGMWLVGDKEEVIKGLGPEPLESDFTPQVLAQLLKQHSAPIKVVLIDQSVIAGIGNMYADEILFAAKIHPLRRAKDITLEEIDRIFEATHQVLKAAIKNKGATMEDGAFHLPSGEIGQAQFQFQVAHRGGMPCPTCSTPIQRLPLRGRGTYFCPLCQRL